MQDPVRVYIRQWTQEEADNKVSSWVELLSLGQHNALRTRGEKMSFSV